MKAQRGKTGRYHFRLAACRNMLALLRTRFLWTSRPLKSSQLEGSLRRKPQLANP